MRSRATAVCLPTCCVDATLTPTGGRERRHRRARHGWMDETIQAVRITRAEGVPVVGYTWFLLISMIEWDYRTGERPIAEHLLHLGLWDSRFDECGILQRHATSLVETYRNYVTRGAP
jgi:beta-glucosidase